jgi:Leucine-rich repeat (LRR) protein
MKKVIGFVLTMLVFMSPIYPGIGNDGSKTFFLDNQGARISLSFEHHKMKDGWTPVVFSIGELDYPLWMDTNGKVWRLPEPDAQSIDPVYIIDESTHRVQKDGTILNFDVYEQNSIRTRWRLSPRTTEGKGGAEAKSRTCATKPAGTVSSAIPVLERTALIALYNSANGDDWRDNSGWKTPPLAADGFALPGTENTWYGITCDPGNTTVLSVNLFDNNLNGAIPPELGNLANLQELLLSLNQLSGSIPPELGNLVNLLYLSLDSNQLNGSIPTQLGNLVNLLFLRVMDNQVSGSIPPELGNLANLISLNLKSNQLSGSIPPELGNLANLQSLDLNWNLLSGNIPPELGNMANLQKLSLYGNQLNGSIPPQLGNLVNLQYISLGLNQLNGAIPPELGNLANLHSLYLESNLFSGSIPPELGNLANLHSLYLYGNQLSGAIPPELANLANLELLFLNSNQFSGIIPPGLGNLANLQYLELYSNQLSGSIPPELGNLVNLHNLRLHSNKLSGSIPVNLINLTDLNNLDIRWNALYTNDDILRAFLDSKDMMGDWESTQTIAPSNVTAFAVSTSSIAVNWTPIAYTADTGGYRVFYSTVHGGPYTFFGMTADKTASSLTVTGLNPGVAYYFTVKTRTNPHTYNLNKVVSGYSAEASTLLSRLVLTAPNGGESWALGTVQNITWSTSGLTDNVRIELWKANNRSCIIAYKVPIANGNYIWAVGNNSVVPIPVGNDYKVKIITVNGLYNDASNGNFSIVK